MDYKYKYLKYKEKYLQYKTKIIKEDEIKKMNEIKEDEIKKMNEIIEKLKKIKYPTKYTEKYPTTDKEDNGFFKIKNYEDFLRRIIKEKKELNSNEEIKELNNFITLLNTKCKNTNSYYYNEKCNDLLLDKRAECFSKYKGTFGAANKTDTCKKIKK